MTERLTFSDQYLVGIKQVDREHRRLFEIVRNIQDGLQLDGPAAMAAARTAVSELIDYTQTHFTSEEALMAKAGYPELPAHRRQHEELIAQVRDMEMRVELEGESAAIDLSRFVSRWLTQHIQDVDKRFGAYVAASGATFTP